MLLPRNHDWEAHGKHVGGVRLHASRQSFENRHRDAAKVEGELAGGSSAPGQRRRSAMWSTRAHRHHPTDHAARRPARAPSRAGNLELVDEPGCMTKPIQSTYLPGSGTFRTYGRRDSQTSEYS